MHWKHRNKHWNKKLAVARQTKTTKTGLVAFHNIRPGNVFELLLQPLSQAWATHSEEEILTLRYGKW